MGSRYINQDVQRRLYAESMGRCMNPSCKQKLFSENGNIVEKAHIDPYCETADNSFENLVLLCPNCHTDFDKNHAFTAEEVLSWKQIRKEELERHFNKRFTTFDKLKDAVVPLLMENKTIYENYFLQDKKALWDYAEPRILANNRELKMLLSNNLNLFQKNSSEAYSNLNYVLKFIAHIDEFEATREDEEKTREILFPQEINSIFGIAPVSEDMIPSVESLEFLIEKLMELDQFEGIILDDDKPFIQLNENGNFEMLFLDDTPRLRQLYHNYGCFRTAKVRIKTLIFALKYINRCGVSYRFVKKNNLREIMICDTKMIFVYEYCLSSATLRQLLPEENSVIVNLHNWNGSSCISKDAYALAKQMNVKLLTQEAFYDYIKQFK